MPKAVDIYVLDKKIGSGQFGDVFKGYSKIDGSDVAIKTINRSKIKGKFTQLLENQIQVLRSCKNNNIVRLIDIKKTANNIYLILEYCNEGDLNAYLKNKKKLPQEEAVQCLVQILHAFQTLVKNKIMHRDFKLANVLRHDGCIKIADFGFAKLLGSEDQKVQTILGSPLNMAPEVLDHQSYNSKADIWSIGVGFYELLFGKVPYTAGNIIDLLKKIKKQPLSFPSKVSPVIEDVIRKMLVVDPAKRIEWAQLFKHPVTRFLQQKIQEGLQKSMLCKKQELPFNISKFYIQTNKIIENVNQIRTKKQLNGYLRDVINSKDKNSYQGTLIKRNLQRSNKQNIHQKFQILPTKTQKQLKDEEPDSQINFINSQSAKAQNLKHYSKIILQQRNIYAFLGHIAQQIMQNPINSHGQCVAFLMVKNIVQRVGNLKQSIKKRQLKGIQKWQQFQDAEDYKEIIDFLSAEQQIFNRFYEKLSFRVLSEDRLAQFQQDLMISGKFTRQETNRRIFEKVLLAYIGKKYVEPKKLSHAIQMIKIVDGQSVDLKFSDPKADLADYYQWFLQTEEEQIRKMCKSCVEKFYKEIA